MYLLVFLSIISLFFFVVCLDICCLVAGRERKLEFSSGLEGKSGVLSWRLAGFFVCYFCGMFVPYMTIFCRKSGFFLFFNKLPEEFENRIGKLTSLIIQRKLFVGKFFPQGSIWYEGIFILFLNNFNYYFGSYEKNPYFLPGKKSHISILVFHL